MKNWKWDEKRNTIDQASFDQIHPEVAYNLKSCQEFTGIMKDIVDQKQIKNEYFMKLRMLSITSYNVDCDDYRNFEKDVNNSKNIHILRKYNSVFVNHIETKFDKQNNKVYYILNNLL